MKKVYISVLWLLLMVGAVQAQYSTRTFSYGGVTRQYLLYLPTGYDSTQSYPFVIALHGLGDNINSFKNINLKAVADTAQFIFAMPQALVDQVITGSSAWNAGVGQFGVTLNPNVDDVGFLNALMDTVSANYNINQLRIYATGFSMGGFMSNRLACELNNRVAAIASVSGTIGSGVNCQPARAIPVAHFHGTADGTISYSANPYGMNAEPLVNYWVTHNGCDTTAMIDSLPNTKADGKTIIRYRYLNGDYNTEVEFYKVVNGGHDWLTPANDITYTVEIWRFFNRFEWAPQVSGIGKAEMESALSVYPNPAQNEIHISMTNAAYPIQKIVMTDVAGRNVLAATTPENSFAYIVNTNTLSNGIYFATIYCGNSSVSRKIVISK